MATAKKYKDYKSPDDLPAMLRVSDCAGYTGTNIQTWYEIFKRDDFKTIKLGNRLLVTKKEFLRFLESLAA
ncbi:hypothetical protein [Natronospora cellulosivora (SeqCode)]